MTNEEFCARFKELSAKYEREVSLLVNEARNGLDTRESVWWYDYDKIEKDLDSVVIVTGWMHDRMRGVYRKDRRGSMEKKLRKALGYYG